MKNLLLFFVFIFSPYMYSFAEEQIDFLFMGEGKKDFVIPIDIKPEFKSLVITHEGDKKINRFFVSFNGKDWSDKDKLTSYILNLHPNPDTTHKKIMMVWAFMKENMYAHTPPIANWSIHDAVFNLNVFGYGICDDYAHMMEGLVVDYLKILPQKHARVWSLSGHVVPEFYYDGVWHSPDANICHFSIGGNKVLGVQELAGEKYNHIITEVLKGNYGKKIAGIYATTGNNLTTQKWRNSPRSMYWRLYPGETIEYHRDNFGKYYSKIDHTKEPKRYSNGRIILKPVDYFPGSLFRYENIKKDKNGLCLQNPDKPGFLLLRIQCPYMVVDPAKKRLFVSFSKNGLAAFGLEFLESEPTMGWFFY